MEQDDAKLIAKFNLVDLAGSERISESENNQERIEESKYINSSLSTLCKVVAALSKQAKDQKQDNLTPRVLSRRSSFQSRSSLHNQTPSNLVNDSTMRTPRRTSCYENKVSTQLHIPYRDCKLTHILKDSLGSNSFTNLIINLSPSVVCIGETKSTMHFTKIAKAVKNRIFENTNFKNEL